MLIVDDEEAIRSIMRRTLARFGYRTIIAANGAEAIAAYVAYRRDVAVVIVDMGMPVMDGPATIVALKSLDPAIRIIGSSGTATGELDTGDVGTSHFISKPYCADVVLRALRQVLTT